MEYVGNRWKITAGVFIITVLMTSAAANVSTSFILPAFAGGNFPIFATGSTLELDRCASAWLIKRYVEPQAVFRFYPDGELVETGTPFDTADSRLSRTHNRSTFEVIVDTYGISNEKVQKLAELVHDVEINYWGARKSQISRKVEMEVNALIAASADNQKCLQRCFRYFDRLIEDW